MEPKDAISVLKQYWGYSAFRSGQVEIIDAVCAGQDTLALLPTGGGKSICYQVPAMLKEGLVLVVSPLVALMKDQVENLATRQIPALAIHSAMSRRELDIELDKAVFGRYKLIYCSPERLETPLFQARLEKMNISLIAVDEAHCISEWGFDFRPSYLRIAELREQLPDTPLLALTASATPEVSKDIQEKLLMKEQKVVQNSFSRPNLGWIVRESPRKNERLTEGLKKMHSEAGSGLVYVRSRRKARELGLFLQQNGFSASWYHAGLSADQRTKRQRDWMEGKLRIMVCTTAFGMGIDKADVRMVFHADLPESIEAYYQESGRAGRDGQPAWAGLFWEESDAQRLEEKAANQIPEIDFIRKVYNQLGAYFNLAYGSGEGQVFDFELADFCRKRKLDVGDCWNAIKILQDEAWLTVAERVYFQSKARITATRDTLYRFQVENKRLDPLIKAVLRTCSGIHDYYATVEEAKVASMLNVKTEEVKSGMQELHNLKILDYQAASDSPKLIWLQPRYNGKLPLDRSHLEWRRERHIKRAAAVLDYVKQDKQCRALVITDYFGEKVNQPCGNCDVCKKRNLNNSTQDLEAHTIAKIKKIISKAPLSVEELALQITTLDSVGVGRLIEQMLDQDILSVNAAGKLLYNAAY